MLEQEAHTLGLRERVLPVSGIGSPQHLQTREFIAIQKLGWDCAAFRGAGHRHAPAGHGQDEFAADLADPTYKRLQNGRIILAAVPMTHHSIPL